MSDETYNNPEPVPADQSYETAKSYGAQIQVRGGMHLGDLRIPKVRSVVQAQIAELERQLVERKDLLQQLDDNPATEKLLDTMRRLGV